MGGLGPMAGQAHHFRNYAPEPVPYGIERYTNEVARLHRVLDKRLEAAAFLAGDAYSIADICTFPWIRMKENKREIALHAHALAAQRGDHARAPAAGAQARAAAGRAAAAWPVAARLLYPGSKRLKPASASPVA